MRHFRIKWLGLFAVLLAAWMNTAAVGEEADGKASKKGPSKIDDTWYDLAIDIACRSNNQKCKAIGNINLVNSFAKKFEFDKACKRSKTLRDITRDLDDEFRQKADKLSKDVCSLMAFWSADVTGKAPNRNTWEIIQRKMRDADDIAKEGIKNPHKNDEAISYYRNIVKTGKLIEDDEVTSIASIRLAELILLTNRENACIYFDKIKGFAKSHLKTRGIVYQSNFETVNRACGNRNNREQ
jgi:hypothetical protein